MKKIHEKRLKTTALVLAFLVLFQGCVVYHKTPTTLEQARQEHIKTKIITSDQKTIKYKYIAYWEGTFYGVRYKKGEFVRTPLEQEEIIQVFKQNKSASAWMTVAAFTIPVTLIIVAMSNIGFNLGTGTL